MRDVLALVGFVIATIGFSFFISLCVAFIFKLFERKD